MGQVIGIAIEPIMKFTPRLLAWIEELKPNYVFVGANSKTSMVNLVEPSKAEVQTLIEGIKKIDGVTLYQKSNLIRLL